MENQTGKLGDSLSVWEMNHADLKATHTFGADTKVRPVTKNVALKTAGNTFRYTFPAHSLTILKVRVQ
jgi:alpha-L-arabinofuranosidase